MKSSPTPQGSPGRRDVFMALAAAIVATGVLQALRLSWTADDAHLSFRYAEQLVRGHGLVFNPGERVEGYTNFLWTLWSAVGLRCGVGQERWADSWSIACYAGTLALMAGLSWRDRDPRTLAVPIAACLYALHHDAASFATSGLETAAFCFLALAGYVLLTSASIGLARSVAAGAVLALCTLTRPDGAVFALLGFAYLCFDIRRHPRAPRAYLVTLVILLAPYLAWKWRFYGDLLPNTFYAKSGYASWYSQGGTYLLLYLRRYWVLVLGPLVALPILLPRRRPANSAPEPAARGTGLALAFACVYAFSIVRVGGDFMYARMLLPATPFLLIALERGVVRLTRGRGPARVAVAAGLAVAELATPSPLPGPQPLHGIVDERAFYQATRRDSVRALGLRLERSFEGLPVRMAFTGGQAILADLSRADVALETSTGLTDRTIAHQRLSRRGRVGHEKWTPLLYLIETRRADFVMFTAGWLSDSVAAYVPLITGRIEGAPVTLLNWRPQVVDSLRARGAEIADFRLVLDRLIARLPELSDADVGTVYGKTRRFYFANVSDPAREAPFLSRLRQRSAPR